MDTSKCHLQARDHFHSSHFQIQPVYDGCLVLMYVGRSVDGMGLVVKWGGGGEGGGRWIGIGYISETDC